MELTRLSTRNGEIRMEFDTGERITLSAAELLETDRDAQVRTKIETKLGKALPKTLISYTLPNGRRVTMYGTNPVRQVDVDAHLATRPRR